MSSNKELKEVPIDFGFGTVSLWWRYGLSECFRFKYLMRFINMHDDDDDDDDVH